VGRERSRRYVGTVSTGIETATLTSFIVHKFIYHIGFGYAIGYIMSHEIAVPEDILRENAPNVPRDNINPVTGQRVENECKIPSLANMTEDEKEREAERLFVLFERQVDLLF
jgi:hypothetical protein